MKTGPEGVYWTSAYVDVDRFVSYAYQLNSILQLGPATVLEIGIGPGIVSGFLKRAGLKVTTCDIVPSLQPDCLGDVRALPFTGGCFDVVAAFEILEHMPFDHLEPALSELHRVSGEFVVISLPYACASFDAIVRVNAWKLSRLFSIAIRVPYFFRRQRKPSEAGGKVEQSMHHYWEVGRRGHSTKTVRSVLGRVFKIEKEFQVREHPYHQFFVLRKTPG